jgi:hypothetical protein
MVGIPELIELQLVYLQESYPREVVARSPSFVVSCLAVEQAGKSQWQFGNNINLTPPPPTLTMSQKGIVLFSDLGPPTYVWRIVYEHLTLNKVHANAYNAQIVVSGDRFDGPLDTLVLKLT